MLRRISLNRTLPGFICYEGVTLAIFTAASGEESEGPGGAGSVPGTLVKLSTKIPITAPNRWWTRGKL